MKNRWIFLLTGVCVVRILYNRNVIREMQDHTELLCSDGRCGQSSKLSKENADRDLDLWADKEELKSKLDELQTVMDRGMTHTAASQQLNQYFNSLDEEARMQKEQALKQAEEERLPGYSSMVLSTRKSQKSIKLTQNAQPLYDDKRSVKKHNSQPKLRQSGFDGKPEMGKISKLSAAAAVADLNAYFDSLPTSKRASKVGQ